MEYYNRANLVGRVTDLRDGSFELVTQEGDHRLEQSWPVWHLFDELPIADGDTVQALGRIGKADVGGYIRVGVYADNIITATGKSAKLINYNEQG